jgi:hypothetical protein
MLFLLAPVLLTLAAPQDAGIPLPFRVIDGHAESGFDAGMEKFISSTPDWVAIWMERQRNVKTKVPHPNIDFDRHAIVVVAMGRKNTDGYSVEITRMAKTKDDIRIFLRKTVPGPNAKPAAKVTSPFVMARIEKPDRPVVFIDEPKK